MDCPACGAANDAPRRWCRGCGGRLGGPCPACLFFNGFGDRHCGGCGRLLAGAGPLATETAPAAVYAPALAAGGEPAAAAAEPAGHGVSQSEIDGLFENMLGIRSAEAEE